MSLRINNNISSLKGQHNLARNDQVMSKSLERLSSGMKINRAADNAAGLVISEQMRAQISGLRQAADNTAAAVSMVQTAEGALDEVNNLLTKARELTLHAANTGVNDTNQLVADQSELDNVLASITRIGMSTQFGTKKLLDGSLSGTSSLGAGLDRVRVGNLANNAAISTGTMTVSGTIIQEANLLKASGTQSDTFVFSNGASSVTGFNVGLSATMSTGVNAAVTIGTGTYTVAASGLTMTGTADALTAAVVAASGGYTVTFDNAQGGFLVTRNLTSTAPAFTDFTAAVTISKAAVTTTGSNGTDASSSMTVSLTSGGASTPAQAANVLFGASNISGISTASVVSDLNQIYTLEVNTATGSVQFKVSGDAATGAGTYQAGDTLGTILGRLEALVEAGTFTGADAFAGSGATLAFTAGTDAARGFTVALSRNDDALTRAFTSSLRIDHANTPVAVPEIHTLTSAVALSQSGVGGATGSTLLSGGVSVATLAAAESTAVLTTGHAIALTVNGQTFVRMGNGVSSVSGIAAALQGQVQAALGASIYVYFASGGNTLSGATAGLITGAAVAAGSFVVFDTSGALDMQVSLIIDQADGSDILTTAAEVQDGSPASATLNFESVTSTSVTGVATVAATTHAAATIGTVSGLTSTTSGSSTFTLTTSSGASLALAVTGYSTSGVASLVLDATNTGTAGYRDLLIEIGSGMVASGGSATFTMDNGAEFQIGANAATTGNLDQKVGITIDRIDAVELGRNATGRGTLNSLADLASNVQGALINGKTDEAMAVIDKAIDQVTNLRGKLGAVQANTLETNSNSLRTAIENLTAAESTIRDTDFALESANFTKHQILVQSATAMLAQANQQPQGVLSLLR
jgi:flagellin